MKNRKSSTLANLNNILKNFFNICILENVIIILL